MKCTNCSLRQTARQLQCLQQWAQSSLVIGHFVRLSWSALASVDNWGSQWAVWYDTMAVAPSGPAATLCQSVRQAGSSRLGEQSAEIQCFKADSRLLSLSFLFLQTKWPIDLAASPSGKTQNKTKTMRQIESFECQSMRMRRVSMVKWRRRERKDKGKWPLIMSIDFNARLQTQSGLSLLLKTGSSNLPRNLRPSCRLKKCDEKHSLNWQIGHTRVALRVSSCGGFF